MIVYKMSDYEAMSRRAAGILASQVILKPRSVLGLATGSTPEGIYKYLAEWNSRGDLDFSEITTVNLDEYIGLSPDHPQSYRYFMQKHLLGLINIAPENTHVPSGLARDAAAECRRYETLIENTGGIDVQLLGIGLNGHIGFNEPDDEFAVGTHAVDLTDSTIQANKRFFASEAEVPRRAYTMGIGTIMKARKIILAASGEEKAEIIKRALTGPVTPQVPASVLQLHPNVVLLGDAAALALL